MPDPISGRFEISGRSSSEVNITMDGDRGYVKVGDAGKDIIIIDGENGRLSIGGDGKSGQILVKDKTGSVLISIDAKTGNITVGGKGRDGELIIMDESGKAMVRLGSDAARFRAYSTVGHEICYILNNGDMHLGGNNYDGDLYLLGRDNKHRIRLDADQANMWLGGNDRDGDILLFSKDGDNQSLDEATIHLNGDAGEISVKGDIRLLGADCAENFPVDDKGNIEPGTVLIISENSDLVPCRQKYDKRVAGVVSGAGNCHPGIILNDQSDQENLLPVALTGKVYCRVNNEGGPIMVGDMLTTSSKPGNAMKVSDPDLAFGAVLGKALLPMWEESGMIPILVTLH